MQVPSIKCPQIGHASARSVFAASHLQHSQTWPTVQTPACWLTSLGRGSSVPTSCTVSQQSHFSCGTPSRFAGHASFGQWLHSALCQPHPQHCHPTSPSWAAGHALWIGFMVSCIWVGTRLKVWCLNWKPETRNKMKDCQSDKWNWTNVFINMYERK
jgi:hypothetical protein